MIITGYQKLVSEGMDKLPQYMGDFLTASNMAGFAFGTAGCAAVHALSYPLGGTYHVPHGESNYALFTGVLYKYMEKKQDRRDSTSQCVPRGASALRREECLQRA